VVHAVERDRTGQQTAEGADTPAGDDEGVRVGRRFVQLRVHGSSSAGTGHAAGHRAQLGRSGFPADRVQ
jgi:hypothetical protein